MKIISTSTLAFLSLSISCFGQQKENKRINILWLSCEDMDPLLSCYGAEGIKTPNLDRLAQEGIRYTNAFSTAPVSAPSRSSVITGMYAVSIGTHNMRTGNHYAFRELEKETYNYDPRVKDNHGRHLPTTYSAVLPSYVKCFTEYLRAAGYYCTNTEKCDYQFACPITAWDEFSKDGYKHRPASMPFFSVINFDVTHESKIWMNKNHPMLVNTDSIPIPSYYADIPVVRKDVGRKFSNMEELDAQIGKVLDELKKENLLDKTIIFFWSDHGGPLLHQKRSVGNSGLRVPLIVRFPDKRMAGSVVSDIVSLMDLGPTVLSLAGIKPPEYMQGKAIMGKYKSTESRKYAFGAADRFEEANDMTRSVIDGRYVYIHNFFPELPMTFRHSYREQIEMTRDLIEMDSLGKLKGDAAYIFMKTKPEEELYDLQNDPYEVKNVANDPAYADKLKELRSALFKWQTEVCDKGFIDEYFLLQMMWPGFVQPETDEVVFSSKKNEGLILTCKTIGASIGYQVGEDIGGKSWKLYSRPLKLKKGDTVLARAVRIGYKTSKPIKFMMP